MLLSQLVSVFGVAAPLSMHLCCSGAPSACAARLVGAMCSAGGITTRQAVALGTCPASPYAKPCPPPLADVCKLKLTVLNDTQSGEHKVKLLGVVLSEDTGFLISEEKVRSGGGDWQRRGRAASWLAHSSPCSAKQRKVSYATATLQRIVQRDGQATLS